MSWRILRLGLSAVSWAALMSMSEPSRGQAAVPSREPAQSPRKARTPEPSRLSPQKPNPAPAPSDFDLDVFGFVELDSMHDTTQSFGAGTNNVILQRPGTFQGDHARLQFTVNNSQVGLSAAAPRFEGMVASGQVVVDFFGVQASEVTEQDVYTQPGVRLRLAFVELETPIVDVLAGQYHDLFGWGGEGFYPNSVAFLGLLGQVYHRQPQVRITRAFGSKARLEVAAAATRPVQRDSQIPDAQAGLKFSLDAWRGANAQGFGKPSITPLSVGVSGVFRRFSVTEYRVDPQDTNQANGYGASANAFIPVIPARSAEDRSNALSLTGEFVLGTGISDLYLLLTGGARFPTLPNPGGLVPPPIYRPNIDPGIVTYDANFNLQTIDWTSFVVGLQYYLPIAGGRVWLSANYSQIMSDNLADLTPQFDHGAIFDKARYFDANVYAAVTPAVQLGLSFQRTEQTFGDGVDHSNHRTEGGVRFFF